MPIPHDVAKKIIRERLKNLEGKAKVRAIEALLEEFPQYKSGPFGQIRSELMEEIQKTRMRKKIKAREFFGVRKEGHFQLFLVGQPSSGKSTLLNAITNAHAKTAAYEFTTLKPQAGILEISGINFQLVDLPGIIEGATEGKGLGKKILSTVGSGDCLLAVADLGKPIQEFEKIVIELQRSELIDNPKLKTIIIGNKIDLPQANENLKLLKQKFPLYPIVATAGLTKTNLEELKKQIWSASGLMRIYSQKDSKKPLALKAGSTVKEFAEHLHKELGLQCKYAHIWGPSAKFPGQKVGLDHTLFDGDSVELVK